MSTCVNGESRPDSAADLMARLSERAEANLIPLRGLAELTYRCNLRCVHCYCSEDGRAIPMYAGRRELSTDEWRSAFDQTAAAGCLELTLTGGELLVRRDWHVLADHAVRSGFAVTLFTAGTLVDEAAADRIAGLGVVAVELSLHAMDPAVFEGITRIPGSFGRLMRAIALLRERNVPLLLKATLMRVNAGEYRAIAEFARAAGARLKLGIEMSPRNDGSRGPLALQMTPRQLEDYYRSEVPEPWTRLERETPEAMRGKELCGAGKTGFSINPYGDVYPCNQLLVPVGNLRERGFRSIWFEQPTDELRRLRATKTFGDLPECGGCAHSYACRRCPGIAHLETGDFNAASPSACDLAAFTERINDAFAGASPAAKVEWITAGVGGAFEV